MSLARVSDARLQGRYPAVRAAVQPDPALSPDHGLLSGPGVLVRVHTQLPAVRQTPRAAGQSRGGVPCTAEARRTRAGNAKPSSQGTYHSH